MTKVILFGCFTSCVFLFAHCNNAKKKADPAEQAQTENTVQPSSQVDTNLNLKGPNTAKVYHDYIKDHIDSLSRLIEQNPKEPEYYLRRGDLKISQGDNAGGCEDYGKAESLGSKNMQTLIDKYCK